MALILLVLCIPLISIIRKKKSMSEYYITQEGRNYGLYRACETNTARTTPKSELVTPPPLPANPIDVTPCDKKKRSFPPGARPQVTIKICYRFWMMINEARPRPSDEIPLLPIAPRTNRYVKLLRFFTPHSERCEVYFRVSSGEIFREQLFPRSG